MKVLRKLSGSSQRSSVTTLTATVAKAEGKVGLGLNADNFVTAIKENSSAASTEIRVGDRILSVDGVPLSSRTVTAVLAEHNNPSVTFGIERQSNKKRLIGARACRRGRLPQPRSLRWL